MSQSRSEQVTAFSTPANRFMPDIDGYGCCRSRAVLCRCRRFLRLIHSLRLGWQCAAAKMMGYKNLLISPSDGIFPPPRSNKPRTQTKRSRLHHSQKLQFNHPIKPLQASHPKTKTSPCLPLQPSPPPRRSPPTPHVSSAATGPTVPRACAMLPELILYLQPPLRLSSNTQPLSAITSGPHSTSRSTGSAAMGPTAQPALAI